MKKRKRPVIIAFLLILLVIAVFLGVWLIEKYTPSKERVDVKQMLNIDGSEVALFLNEELQDIKGVYAEGQTYLPITWVNENLNDRFYWDGNEDLLVYALPESILYANQETTASTGKPLLLVKGDEVYLSLGLIINYTDIRVAAYDAGDYKRIYVNNIWEPENKSVVKKNGSLRLLEGIKSPVITNVERGSSVFQLESSERWSRVRTEDGYIGYIENRRLKPAVQDTPVSTFVPPVYRNISLDKEIRMVWHQVTQMEANLSMKELISDTAGVNVISPTWYALTDNEGGYTSYASKAYVDQAHEMGIQVWALIDNFSDQVNTEILLGSTSNRKKLIQKLMNEVDTYGLDGLNLDFEGIKKEAGVHYVQFIRELSVSCREKGVILSVDNYVPTSSNQFYNRKEQGIVADYVIIMGYDEHYAGSEPGSVASLGYVREGIDNTLKVVPKEKVINGIPFFTRVWTEGDKGSTSSALGIAKAKQWISDNHVELYWQEELGQYYGEADSEEGKKMIWMEEEKSIALKMELIRDRQLAGVACWKLGLESPEIWDVITPIS